jgi:hypothetical protein
MAMSDTNTLRGMNVVLFITGQERSIQHFPSGWARENMPGYRFLMEHGLTFPRAFCNACMCSPSRTTLFTGFSPPPCPGAVSWPGGKEGSANHAGNLRHGSNDCSHRPSGRAKDASASIGTNLVQAL